MSFLSLNKDEIWRQTFLASSFLSCCFLHTWSIKSHFIRTTVRLQNRFYHYLLSNWGVRVSLEGRPGGGGSAGISAKAQASLGNSKNYLFFWLWCIIAHPCPTHPDCCCCHCWNFFFLQHQLGSSWVLLHGVHTTTAASSPPWGRYHHSRRLPPACRRHDTGNSDVMSHNPSKSTLFKAERSDEII